MANAILSYYKKLKTREKILTILFMVIIVGSLYYRFLYKPLASNASTHKFQIQKLMTRMDKLNAELPRIDEQKENLRLLTAENEETLNKIGEIEKKLPGKKDASRLIGELTRLAKEFELVSIQQKVDEGEKYSRVFVELTFSVPYKEVVNYIDRIEGISPFLKIEEMEISEPKGKLKGPGVSVRILLSCLLGEAPVSEWFRSEKLGEIEKREPPSVTRDIFVPKSRPVQMARETDLKLEGITYSPQNPTAIINDNVLRVGSEIDGYKVKKILPDTVILTDSIEELSLTLER
jgi:Tfp pilus assembly protein PilO